MSKRKDYPIFKFLKWLIWVFYPKTTAVGTENLSNEPQIIVGNHAQMNGPIVCELYSPIDRYTWCAGGMMELSEVPSYAFSDFWRDKSRFTKPFYKLLSYIIAPVSVCLFNNAETIAVYHDARVASTFKQTVRRLCEGKSIVIFPEHDIPYNHIIYDFQDKFIDVARLYFKKTGKELLFTPMYIAPRLKKVFYGKPIRFDSKNDIDAERRRIRDYLMNEITAIAESQPLHTVVPYRNIKKKDYPKNRRED